MRCGRCGNENADANRFCGMCGAQLAPAPVQAPVLQSVPAMGAPAATPQRVSSPPPAPSTPTPEPRPAANHSDDAPVISGPSFLGLNKPAPSSGRSASLRPSSDHLRSSRNLDYLLEDEEEPKRGFGKLILIVVALALALGFGYLRWKQGGFDWLTGGTKKPSAAQASDGSQPADSGTPAAPAPTTPATTPGSPGADANPAANPAAGSEAANPAPPSGTPSAAPSEPGGAANQAAATQAAANPPAATPAESSETPAKPADTGAASGSESAASAPAGSAATDAFQPKPVRAAKPTPAKPADPVAEAEKFIYGRGVRQDCDRGLRQLKPAAEQANPKAMISLGALYATGVCTPRDLPTAYRWFALALRKQPDNDPLQENLQKIWGQMTPPERQLAIKLSQ